MALSGTECLTAGDEAALFAGWRLGALPVDWRSIRLQVLRDGFTILRQLAAKDKSFYSLDRFSRVHDAVASVLMAALAVVLQPWLVNDKKSQKETKNDYF